MKKKKWILLSLLPLLVSCQSEKLGSRDFDAVSYFFTEQDRCFETDEIIYFREAVNQDFTTLLPLCSKFIALLKETTFTPSTGRVGRNLIEFKCARYDEANKITKAASFYLADDRSRCSFSFVEDYVYSPTYEYAYTISEEEGQRLYSLLDTFVKGGMAL
jgi:hypothetical protein